MVEPDHPKRTVSTQEILRLAHIATRGGSARSRASSPGEKARRLSTSKSSNLFLGDSLLIDEPLGEAKLLGIEAADFLAQRWARHRHRLATLELAQNRRDACFFELGDG